MLDKELPEKPGKEKGERIKVRHVLEEKFVRTEDYLDTGKDERPPVETPEFIEKKKEFYACDLRQGRVETYEKLN